MLRAYKYRLYPNNRQATLMDKHIGCARFVYNLALETRNWAYTAHKINMNYYDLAKQLPDLKVECPWLKEASSYVLQQSLLDLEHAFTKFFKGQSNFPKFKKKNKKQSFRFPARIEIDSNKIYMPKFTDGVRVKVDRTFDGKIKSATISRTPTGKYWVSVLVDTVRSSPTKKQIIENTTVGIDLGITSFLALSDGTKIDNPKMLRLYMERLKILQKRLRNKRKGSNKSKRSNKRIALLHEHIANQRKNFHHQVSRQLVNSHDTLVFETLNIKGMMQNHRLAGAIQDAGWNQFVGFCKYKAEWDGKNVLEIGTFEPSTKMCSGCGHINNDLTLKDREWTCPKCLSKHDRDTNAAKNIEAFGLRDYRKISGQVLPAVRAEQPTMVGALKREVLA